MMYTRKWLMFFLPALVLFAGGAPGSSVQAACNGTISSKIINPGITAYDPFTIVGVNDSYTLTAANTNAHGGDPCVFLLEFTALAVPAKLGNTLNFALTGTGSRDLLTIGTTPPMGLQSGQIPAGAKYDFQFNLVIAAGQFAGPGMYAINPSINVNLYKVENGQYTRLQTVPLTIAYKVNEVRSINLAGGGLNTTLDFGTLMPNAQKSVLIQVRSNIQYGLSLESDNKGQLLLTPPVNGQVWSIGYTASIDGTPFNLGQAVQTRKIVPSSIASTSHNLTVAIGDTANKRAGLYKDVITVNVSAATP
jgi:hypothetical protein